jgi:Bacterial membrane protein YfhO
MPLAQTFFTLVDPETTFLKSSPALDYIAAQPDLFRTYSTHKELSYAAAAAHGLETLDGALSFQIDHSVEIIKAASGCELQGFATGVPPCLTSEIDKDAYRHSQPNAALLGLLNVKFVVSSFLVTDPALTPVSDADGITVYANNKWLPRAFVVGQVELAPDQEGALALLQHSDPAKVAILAEAVVTAGENEGPATARPAMITARRSGYYQMTATGPGWLVLSETWLPGWQARLNGISVPVYRTDYALLGLYVPAGQQTVEFEYQPLGWRIGWPLLVAGLVGLTLWAAWRARRAQRSRS